jgi:hypothetical protein
MKITDPYGFCGWVNLGEFQGSKILFSEKIGF